MIVSQIQLGVWLLYYWVLFESELVSQFGFSCMIINCVLCELISDGLLVCMQGVGIFVVEFKGQLVLFEVYNIVDEIVVCGYCYCCQVIIFGEEVVGFECVLVLDVCEGQWVFYLLIVYYENDILVQIEDCYVNVVVVLDYFKQDFIW